MDSNHLESLRQPLIISEIYINALLYSLGSQYVVLDASIYSLPLKLLRTYVSQYGLASGPKLKGSDRWPREDLDLQLSLCGSHSIHAGPS